MSDDAIDPGVSTQIPSVPNVRDVGRWRSVNGGFHCTAGENRTAWASASLLTLLGVSEDDVMSEFLLTNAQLLPALQPLSDRFAAKGGDPDLLRPVLGVQREYLAASMDEMHINHRTTEGYFADGLGVGPDAEFLARRFHRARLNLRTAASLSRLDHSSPVVAGAKLARGGWFCRCANITPTFYSPWNGSSPLRHSKNTHARRVHIGLRGDLPALDLLRRYVVERPEQATRLRQGNRLITTTRQPEIRRPHVLADESKIFPGFTSRCTRPCPCAASSASATRSRIDTDSAGPSRPPRESESRLGDRATLRALTLARTAAETLIL